jgi:hypothetical protein
MSLINSVSASSSNLYGEHNSAHRSTNAGVAAIKDRVSNNPQRHANCDFVWPQAQN